MLAESSSSSSALPLALSSVAMDCMSSSSASSSSAKLSLGSRKGNFSMSQDHHNTVGVCVFFSPEIRKV